MKIYNATIANLAASVTINDYGFNFYYSDAHASEMASGYIRAINMHSEVTTERFIDNASTIGGNNSPMTIISPEYAPYPFAGNCVIAYILETNGGLTTAEKELEDDFEFIANYSGGAIVGYLVWGTFKVTKTDFYTPELMGNTTTCMSWNPIDGLDHTTLDYSEKIGNALVS